MLRVTRSERRQIQRLAGADGKKATWVYELVRTELDRRLEK